VLEAYGIRGAPEAPQARAVFAGQADIVTVLPFADRTLDDEVLRCVSLDVPLLMLTYTFMVVFVVFALRRGASPCCTAGSAAGVACGGVLCVLASTLAGYGFCAICGVKFTQLQSILPFILLGIGVSAPSCPNPLSRRRFASPRAAALPLRCTPVTLGRLIAPSHASPPPPG